MASSPELKTYQGNCHCGAFKFTVNLPEVKKGTACNCSICSKKGYLWVFPGEGQFKIERGEDKLVTYEFAKKTMAHKFCPTCGTGVIGQRYHALPGKDIGVNARTLIGIDPWSLEVGKYDGQALDPIYEPPTFSGELPQGSDPASKLYTGGCHCGAVTIAYKEKPLPDSEVGMDNCSICARNATTFLYAPTPTVTVGGEENTTSYQFGAKTCDHRFCKICGVPLYIIEENGTIMAVNLKVMQDVEWDDLTIKKDTCGQVDYVVV